MKFVLKVLALVCLIVMSKMAKDDSTLFENSVSKTETENPVFTSHDREMEERSSLTENRSPLSVKIEKSSLHFN